MKTILEARMVVISTARPTSFGQGTGRVGTLWRMTCSSQGAWKIATIRSLVPPAPGNWSREPRCSLSQVTYSLHEPSDRQPQSTSSESSCQYRGGSAGMPVVINRADLPFLGNSHEMEGYLYGDAPVCIIVFDGPPGSGPKLHRHPYAEVFLVQEGSATFTVGEDTLDVTGGQIVVAPAGIPHKFVNSGAGPLRQIDIHANDRFVTEWLED